MGDTPQAVGGAWPGTWNVVAPPAGLGWTPPFTVYEQDGVFTSSLNLPSLAPTGTAYYVDVATGNDGNAGDIAHPLQGIDAAMAKADCVVAYVKPGHYYRDQSMTTWPARNFSLRRWPGESGRILCSWAQTGLTFTNDPTYTNTWTTTRTNVLRVLDCANTDADGDYVQLTHVADAATCNTTQNSWATSGSTVYVNRTDDAEPTFANTWLLVAIAGTTSMTGSYTWYMEHCDFVAMAMLITSNAAGQTPRLYAYDCTFKFAGGWDGLGGDGISIDGSYAYMQNCIAAKNGNDGFNYDTANTNLPYGLEIDTQAYGNGVYGNKGTAQGSSAHTGRVIRLGCEYYENNQENCWDTEGLSWNLGCNFHDPGGAGGASRDCNYASSNTMWVGGCISSGATYDLSCGAGDTIYYSDFTGDASNAAGGTYTEYTPTTSVLGIGGLTKGTSKAPAGAWSGVGVVTKAAGKALSGAWSGAGAIVRATGKGLAGAWSASGGIVRSVATSVAGVWSATGAITRATAKSMSGAWSGSGSVTRRIGKVLAGAWAGAGALVTLLTAGVTPDARASITTSEALVLTITVSDAGASSIT